MTTKLIIEGTDKNFDDEVIKSEIPTVVDFWASWCAPCKALVPTLEAVAKAYTDKVKVVKVDIERHQKVTQKFGISSIPTLLFFKDGEVRGQIVGAVPRRKIDDAIDKMFEDERA